MGQRIPNAYKHQFDPGLSDEDMSMARRQLGIKEMVGPPEPTPDQMFGGDSYPDGKLKDPMVRDQHGASQGHAAGGEMRPEPTGVMDDKWEQFKRQVGANKAVAGRPLPKAKIPQGAPPEDHQAVLEAAAEAHAPDDDGGLKELKGLIDRYEGKKGSKLDLSPMIALTDSWTGSKLLGSYDAPMGDEEREKVVLGLKSKLFQQEADIKYKREYASSQVKAEELRQKFREEEGAKNRDIKVELAKIRGNQAAAARSGGSDRRESSEKRNYFNQSKKALTAIAKKRFPGAGPEDRSHELRMGPINDEVFDFGKHLEAEGQAKPGMGYNTALEFYLQNASGPDGSQ